MNCANNGKKAAHDHLDDTVCEVARPAQVNYTNNKDLVPAHDDSNQKGDALTTLTHAAKPQVLDFTLVHPYSGAGAFDDNVLQDRHKRKMDKHNNAYSLKGYSFVPCVATTYGAVQADFLRLLYILARRQAEVIITYHRPDADFDHMLGLCFAANRAKVGAAIARGMAMRALSYCKHGVRRLRCAHHDRLAEQGLDVLGGPGIALASLAPGA